MPRLPKAKSAVRSPNRVQKAKLQRSPRSTKKWRVTLVLMDGTETRFDFGQKGAPDFTSHKDAARMIRYLRRHAGDVPRSLARLSKSEELDPASTMFNKRLYNKTVALAAKVERSHRERWTDPETRGFWSRWLSWSHPDLEDAKTFIQKRFSIKVS